MKDVLFRSCAPSILIYFDTPTCITCFCPTGSGWFQVVGTILIIPVDHSLKGRHKQVTVSEMWL